MTTFSELGLSEPLLKALADEGYTRPTPIQAEAIPIVLSGKDLFACAQTGTGKTAAFALPILQMLESASASGHQDTAASTGRRPSAKPIRALVLTPTRELALQIEESFRAYGRYLPLNSAVIFGGVGQQAQVDQLKKGLDILIATPGRLLDLMNQGFVRLDGLTHFVLDEADRMLDMGFIHDVRKVIRALPDKRHSLFFSATVPESIRELASQILHQPRRVEVTPVSSTAETIQQKLYFTNKGDKGKLILHLIAEHGMKSALVFTRTKHGANKLAEFLEKHGHSAMAIHGNKSQTARQAALKSFKDGTLRCLVATDLASRGIDIDLLEHVVNYEIPNIPETYVHRIGRTGRAGERGTAYSLCEPEELDYIRSIEKLISRPIPRIEDHPFPMDPSMASQKSPSSNSAGRRPQPRHGAPQGQNRNSNSTSGGGFFRKGRRAS